MCFDTTPTKSRWAVAKQRPRIGSVFLPDERLFSNNTRSDRGCHIDRFSAGHYEPRVKTGDCGFKHESKASSEKPFTARAAVVVWIVFPMCVSIVELPGDGSSYPESVFRAARGEHDGFEPARS